MDEREILQGLIACNTANPPGNERNAAVYIKEILEQNGIRCRIQELGGNRANVTAVLGHSGPEMLLNGHLDVVPATGGWKHNPFILTEDMGRYYGRGVSDMKGAVASMCMAAIRIAGAGGLKRGRLKLFFTADEECSNIGTHAYLKQNPASDFAVIGEPTGLGVAVAHRGVVRTDIEIHGRAMHAALLEDEDTAAEDAAKAVLALKELHRKLQKDRHPILGPASLAVTKLAGYEKDNVVPRKVNILTDLRILPGMQPDAINRMLEKQLYEAGVKKCSVSTHFAMPGGEVCPEDPFVKRCCMEAEKVIKRPVGPTAFGASCEQCFFIEKGIKTVICGPGNLEQAHTVDEWLEKSQLFEAAKIYEGIVRSVLEGSRAD